MTAVAASIAVLGAMQRNNAEAARAARGSLRVWRQDVIRQSSAVIERIEAWRKAERLRVIEQEIAERAALNRFLPRFLKRPVDSDAVRAWFEAQPPLRGDDTFFRIRLTYGRQYQTARELLAMANASSTQRIEVSAEDWATVCR